MIGKIVLAQPECLKILHKVYQKLYLVVNKKEICANVFFFYDRIYFPSLRFSFKLDQVLFICTLIVLLDKCIRLTRFKMSALVFTDFGVNFNDDNEKVHFAV